MQCSISASLFTFVVDVIMGTRLSSCANSGTDIYSDGKLSDLEYANSVVFLDE